LVLLSAPFDSSGPIVFNARFATYLVGITVFAMVARLASDAARTVNEPAMSAALSKPDLDGTITWTNIAAVSAIIVNLLILLAVGFEIHAYWWSHALPQTLPQGNGDVVTTNAVLQHLMYEQFSYSVWAMVFGATLLALGFWRRSAFLRWQALLLLTLSIAKVFVVDVSELSQGYRIVSFLGLGALLLAISFAYQRDWLGLRAQLPTPSSSSPEPAE
jgi:hypothetical protein